MSNDERVREGEDERLDDLEPDEDDNAAVKGGGPKNQTIQTGGGPSD